MGLVKDGHNDMGETTMKPKSEEFIVVSGECWCEWWPGRGGVKLKAFKGGWVKIV